MLQFLKNLLKNIKLLHFFYWKTNSVLFDLKGASHLKDWGIVFKGTPEMEKGDFEQELVQWFRLKKNRYNSMINVGANYGYYTCIFAHDKKPVLAIEPDRHNFKILSYNIKKNKLNDYVKTLDVAVTSKSGNTTIYGQRTAVSTINGWAGQTVGRKIGSETLDAILQSQCDFIKVDRLLVLIDIEGGEFELLKGAENTLRSFNIDWIVEIPFSEHQPDGIDFNPNLLQTFEIFNNHGYMCYTADTESCKISLDRLSLSKLLSMNIKSNNFFFTRNTINT